MSLVDNAAARSREPRLQSRPALRRIGVPGTRDILAIYVRWERIRFYFLRQRRHRRVALSTRAVTDAPEGGPPSPALNPTTPIDVGTFVNLDADLLHFGGQFN